MKHKVIIIENAHNNLEDIVSFIKLDNVNHARNWLQSTKEKILSLSHNPRRGRPVPEYKGGREIREIFLGNYRIIYEIDKNKVFVLYVYHGARLLKL